MPGSISRHRPHRVISRVDENGKSTIVTAELTATRIATSGFR
jgi:hypothetical protein